MHKPALLSVSAKIMSATVTAIPYSDVVFSKRFIAVFRLQAKRLDDKIEHFQINVFMCNKPNSLKTSKH